MNGSASSVEISWTLIGIVGMLSTVWLIVGGFIDRRVVQKAIDADPPRARAWGPRWWVALRNTGMWFMLAYIWLVFVFVGAIAMTYPPPPPNPDQQVSSQWVGWLFISAETVLAIFQGWFLYCSSRVDQANRNAS